MPHNKSPDILPQALNLKFSAFNGSVRFEKLDFVLCLKILIVRENPKDVNFDKCQNWNSCFSIFTGSIVSTQISSERFIFLRSIGWKRMNSIFSLEVWCYKRAGNVFCYGLNTVFQRVFRQNYQIHFFLQDLNLEIFSSVKMLRKKSLVFLRIRILRDLNCQQNFCVIWTYLEFETRVFPNLLTDF